LAQALASRGCEFVELRATVVLGRPPACLEQSLPDETKQTRIERALFDQQRVAGDLADAQQDPVSVQRAEGDRPQDEEIERTGKNLSLFSHVSS